MKNGLIYTVIFSFILTLIFIIPLSYINTATSPLVKKNEEIEKSYTIMKVLGIDTPKDKSSIEKLMSLKTLSVKQSLKEIKYDSLEDIDFEDTVFEYDSDNGKIYAKTFSGPGLWGPIDVVIAFTSDLKKIKGFLVIKHVETPGLGSKVAEDWFTNQFVDQKIGQKDEKTGLFIKFVSGNGIGDKNKDDSSVDGITGATRTTDGVKAIVNKAIAQMQTILGGE